MHWPRCSRSARTSPHASSCRTRTSAGRETSAMLRATRGRTWRCLNSGNWLAGYTDPRLGAFLGGPGILALERLVARCDEVTAAEVARRSTVWPAKFVYVGEPGRAEIDGRLLRVGDVVELTEGQADAWADRFSRVVDEETVTS